MPRTIPNADRQATVTESRPPESSADPTPGDRPHPTGPADEQPSRDSRAPVPEAAEGRRERSAARRRSRPAWLDASTVIGSLIGLIGLLIIFGINSMNNRFEDLNNRFNDMSHHIHMRFDAQDAVNEARFAVIDERFDAQDAVIKARFAAVDERFDAIDERFVAIDARFDAIEARLDVVESEIKGLRQDVNDINLRLDLLIGVLEAAEVIPEDVVPKSSTEALAAVGGS